MCSRCLVATASKIVSVLAMLAGHSKDVREEVLLEDRLTVDMAQYH